ncbi:MAG: patatin-like phospholipase family protein [Solirubrobacteraceae bacterium]
MSGAAPNVLVLGGGGLLGEAWMTGVLAGYEDSSGADTRTCRRCVGTSAGSIVAASLVAGRRPRRPGSAKAGPPLSPAEQPGGAPSPLIDASRAGRQVSNVVVGAGALAARVGAPMRALALRAVPEGRRSITALGDEVDRWGATFDGRLRVCAVDAGNGARVVFGSRSAPPASVGQAVAASCAIPAFFAPVRIGDRRYVDGGAWSPTNADAAPAGRGDRVLLLEPTAVLVGGALRAAALLEAVALRRRGALVQIVTPDDTARPLMGRLMNTDRGGRVLAAGYQQGLALGR